MFNWNAQQYLKFADARTRPAAELLVRVPLSDLPSAIDLGCGPGNSTELLATRWPGAVVEGLDSDADMIARACADYPSLRFRQADLRQWAETAEEEWPLVYANAVLQWTGDHEALFPALLRRVAAGGVLAVQMPRNFQAPSHVEMRRTAAEGPWAGRLENVRELQDVPGPAFYYDLLAGPGIGLDIWETEYTQVMSGVDAIIDWVRGSGLRPYLARLSEVEQGEFINRYREKLRTAYPVQRDGRVLFFFRRIFIVARRLM